MIDKMLGTRKSQIKMGESVAVLLVFFLLVGFGFMFYSKIEERNIMLRMEEAEGLRAIEVAQVISFLPELQCSKDNVVTFNCFDKMKMDAFGGLWDEARIEYFDQLYFSEISVQEVYPGNNAWTIYYNQGTSAEQSSLQIPVAIYYPKEQEFYLGDQEGYAFGIMTVKVYER